MRRSRSPLEAEKCYSRRRIPGGRQVSITDIVFEGGGAKGLALVGALRAIEEAGFRYRRLVGTSAGAISATLVAAGYSSTELGAVMQERLPDGRARFAAFKDSARMPGLEDLRRSTLGRLLERIDLPLISDRVEQRIDDAILRGLSHFSIFRTLLGLTERGGLHPGEAFRAWIEDLLIRKGLGGLSLSEFHGRTGPHLTVVASDVSASQKLLLNHKTAPDLPVAWAVRMSMGIPFLFEEVIWERRWGTYLGRELAGHAVVDGGLLSNFPLELVTSDEPSIQALMGGDPAEDAETIGLLIDEGLSVADDPAPPSEGGVLRELQFDDRLARLVDAMTDARDQAVIAQHQSLVCRLPARGYATTDFDLDPARRDALIAAAYNATKLHISGRARPI